MVAQSAVLPKSAEPIEEFDERWPGIRPVDEELASKIGTIGFHPFVLVRFGTDRGGESDYYVCPTQNELAQFVDELSRLPQLADLKLLRGFERALQGETYEAADVWFSWMREAPAGLLEIVYLGLPSGVDCPLYYGYPIYEVQSGQSAHTADQRLEILSELFKAYCGADGNDATRFLLAEALALALSRCLGARGEYSRALGHR